MIDLSKNFDMAMDAGYWTDVIAVFAGFLAPTVAESALEGLTDMDVPPEGYGLLVWFAGDVAPQEYRVYVKMGSALYIVDSVANRFGIKSRLTEAI